MRLRCSVAIRWSSGRSLLSVSSKWSVDATSTPKWTGAHLPFWPFLGRSGIFACFFFGPSTISGSKWHLRGKYRRRESGRPAILSCGKAELRLQGAIASGMCWSRSRLPPLANSGMQGDCGRQLARAARAGPSRRQRKRARTARRRKCLVTSRGARNIFSPLVDDLTVCDPLCSFCGDRTDNLTPACKRDETPIRRCTHGKSGNDVRL